MNESTQWYQLEPADAWFFRDGRPSNRGEDQSDLESVFPPYPTTIVGALRAALARSKGWHGEGPWNDDLHKVLGNGFDDLGVLRFTGPFLYRCGELLFPIPRNLSGFVEEKDGTTVFNPAAMLEPSLEKVSTDIGEVRLPQPPKSGKGNSKAPKQPDDFYVTASGMEQILSGNRPESAQCVHKQCLYCHEPRIGIERDEDSLTTGENAMYSPHYVRLRPGVSLAVGVTGLPDGWALPSLFPMGGESRMAHCTPISPEPRFPRQPARKGNAVLVLLTPACFDLSRWWGAGPGDSATQLSRSINGTVVTAAIDLPIHIGGWDSVKTKGPLPLHPHAPPGTVWWVEDVAMPGTNGNSLMLGNRTAHGFGLALAGVWPKESTAMEGGVNS